MNTLFNFSKKGANISLLFQKGSVYIIFEFKRLSPRFLKRKKIYAAQINVKGQKHYNEVFSSIRSWLDSISSEYLFEQLCDAPTRYLPIIEHDGLIIDFNVDIEEIMVLSPSS